MLGLIFGLIEGSTDGWSALPIARLAAGAACFGRLLRPAGHRGRPADPAVAAAQPRLHRPASLLGLAFFAAVNGLAYVISLFFQTALGLRRPRPRSPWPR